MVGKNPLWVAKQHGHSVHVMLDVYAAWTEGAKDSDIAVIKHAMQLRPSLEAGRTPTTALIPLRSPAFGTDLALASRRCSANCGKLKEYNGGERGIRTLEGLLTLTPLAGVRLRPLGHLSAGQKLQLVQLVTPCTAHPGARSAAMILKRITEGKPQGSAANSMGYDRRDKKSDGRAFLRRARTPRTAQTRRRYRYCLPARVLFARRFLLDAQRLFSGH